MRKVILDLAVTLDGYIEGSNGEIDWCVMDEEMSFDEFLSDIDAIFYGRVSYDMWGNYQPEATAGEEERKLWAGVHSKEKFVFTSQERTDDRATFITSDLASRVEALKQQPGKNIWLYGGGKLITTFVNLGLVDTFRLAVHPVVLGSGKPLFQDIHDRVSLQLVETKIAKSSGVVQLIYDRL